MARSTSKDAQALFQSLRSAYAATPTTLKVCISFTLTLYSPFLSLPMEFWPRSSSSQIIDLYVMYAVFTALIQVYGFRSFCWRHFVDYCCNFVLLVILRSPSVCLVSDLHRIFMIIAFEPFRLQKTACNGMEIKIWRFSCFSRWCIVPLFYKLWSRLISFQLDAFNLRILPVVLSDSIHSMLNCVSPP